MSVSFFKMNIPSDNSHGKRYHLAVLPYVVILFCLVGKMQRICIHPKCTQSHSSHITIDHQETYFMVTAYVSFDTGWEELHHHWVEVSGLRKELTLLYCVRKWPFWSTPSTKVSPAPTARSCPLYLNQRVSMEHERARSMLQSQCHNGFLLHVWA